MAIYLVIDAESNVVLNAIEWDGVTPYRMPYENCILRQGVGAPGWVWADGEAHDPNPADEPAPLASETISAQTDAG